MKYVILLALLSSHVFAENKCPYIDSKIYGKNGSVFENSLNSPICEVIYDMVKKSKIENGPLVYRGEGFLVTGEIKDKKANGEFAIMHTGKDNEIYVTSLFFKNGLVNGKFTLTYTKAKTVESYEFKDGKLDGYYVLTKEGSEVFRTYFRNNYIIESDVDGFMRVNGPESRGVE